LINTEQPGDRLLHAIGHLLKVEAGQPHLSLDDWSRLLNDEGTDTQIEEIGHHLTHCRYCSRTLLEAEEYAEKVQDAVALARMTPRYVPGSTPSRLILEVAGSRIWAEPVQGGWLLAAMDLDVEVVEPSLDAAKGALTACVVERARELLTLGRPALYREQKMLALINERGGDAWAARFNGELTGALSTAADRIESIVADSPEPDPVTSERPRLHLLSDGQMAELPADFHTALQLTQTMLGASARITDPGIIRRKVRSVLAMMRAEDGSIDVDEELLVRELEVRFTTYIGDWGVLDNHNDLDHRPWVVDRKASTDWKYWRRYERYLREKKGWVPASLSSLGKITDNILDRIGDPKRAQQWDRRGLVVGSVQSGKTANYTGLICKAADAGYKLIIVMAGMHDNLRSQTQRRIDEGFIGYDTRRVQRVADQLNHKIGVGKLRGGGPFFTPITLTSSDIRGDFNRQMSKRSGVVPGGDTQTVVLVVKKNKSILENVRNWALDVICEGSSNQRTVRGVPLLLIDDEADNAGINTARRSKDVEEFSPTEINKQIRLLLNAFDQSSYVGYTATPFANIFISPEDETPELGRDIFPESFIVNIAPPSNYIGPARVFGMAQDSELGNDEIPELPIIRYVADAEAIIPPRHRSYFEPRGLPDTLKMAVRAFILTCAARRARGQKTDHNSMLVHVTRYVGVQKHIERLILEELSELQLQIEFANSTIGQKLLAELEHLWISDFEATSAKMGELAGKPVTWRQVKEQLHEAASRIETRSVNSESKIALDYGDRTGGLSVIVVGGDKLSRGLTLEGLSISYYLRGTNMYDTLMQMGRWFGYRPGYLDLCRLYTTAELVIWYRHITLADAELRREFDRMDDIGATPRQYALRVRTHPEAGERRLLITALNKMQTTVVTRYSFSGRLAEVSFLYRDAPKTKHNFQTTESFINTLGEPESPHQNRGNWVWNDVSSEMVTGFLNQLYSHPHTTSANTQKLARYIDAQSRPMQDRTPELTHWTVVLVSNAQSASGHSSHITIGEWPVVTTLRTPADNDRSEPTPAAYMIKEGRIVNPVDEFHGLTPDLYNEALAKTIEAYEQDRGRRKNPPTRPSGEAVRAVRPPDRGLLVLYPLFPPTGLYDDPDIKAVIGHAVSFPESPTAQEIEYRIGESFWRQELGEEEEDENDV
jgi:hypothetical protein